MLCYPVSDGTLRPLRPSLSMRAIPLLFLISTFLVNPGCGAQTARSGNPVLPGWYADPEAHVFAGQYFDCFDPTPGGDHVYLPGSVKLAPWWPRWIAIDWGFVCNGAPST